MDRRTLDHLKDRLLKRLVDGEIDKSLYDQVLLEIEKASEVAAPASDWETAVDDGVAKVKGLCRSVARNFGLVDSEPVSDTESGRSDDEKERLKSREARLRSQLRGLSILAMIHAFNAIAFGILNIFGVGQSGFAFGVLSVIAGSAMFYTSYCMKTMQSYPFVWWSLFLFLTPIFGLWPLGVLVGIAGLFLLSGDEVERFFTVAGSSYRGAEERKHKETPEERRERKRLQKYS